jgi:hypothetical protein
VENGKKKRREETAMSLRRFVFISLALPALLLFSCFDDKHVSEREYAGVPYPYRTYNDAVDFLNSKQAEYPNFTRIENIGASEKGRAILAFIISNNPDNIEDEPRVRLTGSIHGNEYISGEILFRFIDYLTSEYDAGNSTVAYLIENRYIAIIPIFNPDGHEAGTRYNANKVDINRNFPFYTGAMRSNYHGVAPFDQSESRVMRDFSKKLFHLSVTFHSGEVVVNLPFDYRKSAANGGADPLENSLVWELGRRYADSGSLLDSIFKNNPDVYRYADGGVITGGDWYVVDGSLQDWSYSETGCIDMTVEVARSSPMTQDGIEKVFLYNRDSLLACIESAGEGVSGWVEDGDGNPLGGVSVSRIIAPGEAAEKESDLTVYTDGNGYFMRMLSSGDLSGVKLRFSRADYADAERDSVTGAIGAVTLNEYP